MFDSPGYDGHGGSKDYETACGAAIVKGDVLQCPSARRGLDLAREHGLRGYEAWALYALGEIYSREIPLKVERGRGVMALP